MKESNPLPYSKVVDHVRRAALANAFRDKTILDKFRIFCGAKYEEAKVYVVRFGAMDVSHDDNRPISSRAVTLIGASTNCWVEVQEVTVHYRENEGVMFTGSSEAKIVARGLCNLSLVKEGMLSTIGYDKVIKDQMKRRIMNARDVNTGLSGLGTTANMDLLIAQLRQASLVNETMGEF